MDESVSPFLKIISMHFKRLQFYFFLAALLVSCQEKENASVRLTTPCEGVCAKFDTDTKVALADENSGELTWISGDAIAFSGKLNGSPKTLKLTTQNTASVAEFLPEDADRTTFEDMSGVFLGLYPYDEASFDVDAGTIQGILPEEQTANEITASGRVMPLVLVARSEDRSNMNFYNACSGIRFTVGSEGICKVVFSGNDNETLTGGFKVTLGSDGSDISVEAVGEGENSVVLLSTNGLVPGKLYYLTFLPTEFNSGFKFDFYSTEDNLIVSTCCDISKDVPRGIFGTIKNADDQASMDKVFGGEDLSIEGTANCYIVSASGKYKFPLYKGNSLEKIQSAVKAEVLWETRNSNNAVNVGDIITNIRLNNGYVFFSVPEPFKDGNALIAVRNASDEILWSWHIWNCSSTPSVQKLGDVCFLDRNLGALSVKDSPECFGLLYQWGRKDPFPGAVASSIGSRAATTNYSTQPVTTATDETGTVDYSIAHPYIFILPYEGGQDWIYGSHSQKLWDSSKTVYDPCPAGWKIPGNDVWPENDGVSVYDTGVLFNNMQESWFPSTGFISYDGSDAGKTARAVDDYAFYHTYAGSNEQVQGMRLTLQSTNLKYRNNAPVPKGYGNAVRCVKE